jgi:hypothetical protein
MDAAKPDPVRALIKDRARQLRLGMADLSRHIGRNETYIHQYIRRGSPAILPEEVRYSLAEILGLPEEVLRSPSQSGASVVPAIPPPFDVSPVTRGASRESLPTPLVPVFADTGAVDLSRASEWTMRPPALQSAAGSFALWISSARGRLRPGDIAFVRPTQPPRVGDTVVAFKGRDISAIGDLIGLDVETATVQLELEARVLVSRTENKLAKVVCITPA